jgi:hypothetical protein
MEMEPALAPNIILSDGAIREVGTNKISLIGVFHNVNAPVFPFNIGFFVTPSISNLRGKLDRAKVTIRIEEKASSLVVASAVIEVGSNNELGPSDVLQIPIRVGCSFGSAGLYSVVILFQNEVIGSRDLSVSSITMAPNLPPT